MQRRYGGTVSVQHPPFFCVSCGDEKYLHTDAFWGGWVNCNRAHEIEFAKATGLQEGGELVVNDWKKKGYKDAKIELGKRERDHLASL